MKNIYYILTIISISLVLACSNTTKGQETAVAVENNTLSERKLLMDGSFYLMVKLQTDGEDIKKRLFLLIGKSLKLEKSI